MDKQVSKSTTRIQIVFQGGGAKLVALMAVSEALEEFEQKGRIEITRVAGVSAGAIAAVMLSSPKSTNAYKELVRRIGSEFSSQLRVTKIFAIIRVMSGGPYFGEFSLRSFFEELFAQSVTKQVWKVGDLKPKEVLLYFTDLYTLESRLVPEDESVPAALEKSCRFPFAFLGQKSVDTDVDGGLASNLPVDQLLRDEVKFGSVIAVGFPSEYGSTRKGGIRAFTQQLFAAAIQNGVNRSIALLGVDNVFKIDTPIGTFDFELALADGFGRDYENTKQAFTSWLEKWLNQNGAPATPSPAQKRLIYPPLSAAPWPMQAIDEIDDRLRADGNTHATRVFSYETAIVDEAGQFKGMYLSRLLMDFEARRPINILQFDFEIGREGSFSAAKLGCAVWNKKSETVRFSLNVQELTRAADPLRSFRVFFLFTPRLMLGQADGPYRLEMVYESDDPFPNLGKTKEVSTLIRWQGSADNVLLAVALPRRKLGVAPHVQDVVGIAGSDLAAIGFNLGEEVFVPSVAVPEPEFSDGLRLMQPQDCYFLVGRRAENLRQGEGIGFVID